MLLTMTESRPSFRPVGPHRGLMNYLDVRYGQHKFTDYPRRLSKYLTETFLGVPAKDSRLLDLGAGRGEFLLGFKRLGFQAFGVDVSKSTNLSVFLSRSAALFFSIR